MESFALRVVFVMAFLLASTSAGDFNQDVKITWGNGRGQIKNGGQLLSLSLDKQSGSGFESKKPYLFSRFDVQIQLISGNSAGTVTTFYLSSLGKIRDKIDFEFLGNSSGQPYTVHTNIFTGGKGNREQRFRLWFDPTTSFHTYTILWSLQRIVLMVDNTPIRVFNNNVKYGVPFPTFQPMKMYGSLWNADNWATQGGRVKTDWTQAPFTAAYQNLTINDCVGIGMWNSCKGKSKEAWLTKGLDASGRRRFRWVHRNFLVYNYCDDVKRFPQGLPGECSLPRF